jgi:hypothetical protein
MSSDSEETDRMLAGSTIARLGLAALLSGAAAGLLLILSLFIGALLARSGLGSGISDGSGVGMLLMMIGLGALAGIVLAAPPSFVAGAAMTGFAIRFETARRVPAWAAAGAAVGFGFWCLAALTLRPFFPPSGPGAADAALLTAFLLSGAAAALIFRGVMKLTGRLCVVDPLWWTTGDRDR